MAEIERLEQAFPATVPGEVRLDLMRAGLLKDDPFYGRNNDASRWVEEQDWWYWRDFELELQPGQRAWLVLHGADYYTWTYLNGELLGEHEGMFSRQVYDITKLLRGAIGWRCAFWPRLACRRERSTPWEKFLNRWEHRFIDASCDPDRRDCAQVPDELRLGLCARAAHDWPVGRCGAGRDGRGGAVRCAGQDAPRARPGCAHRLIRCRRVDALARSPSSCRWPGRRSRAIRWLVRFE